MLNRFFYLILLNGALLAGIFNTGLFRAMVGR